jgi:hypothetical protein
MAFIVGLGAGFVLGARSGRERYEQISAKAQQLWRDPRVQEKADQAQQVVSAKAAQTGSAVKDKVASATASHKATSGSAGSGSGTSS